MRRRSIRDVEEASPHRPSSCWISPTNPLNSSVQSVCPICKVKVKAACSQFARYKCHYREDPPSPDHRLTSLLTRTFLNWSYEKKRTAALTALPVTKAPHPG